MMKFTARILAAAVLVLASCTTSSIPQITVAAKRAVGAGPADLRSTVLVKSLAAAEHAWTDPDAAETVYNPAVENVVLELQRRLCPHEWTSPLRVQSGAKTWEIRFDQVPEAQQGKPLWPPAMFDRITPARGFKLLGYDQTISTPGTGLATVLSFEDVEKLRKERAYRAGNGTYVAATALLEFSKPAADGTVPVNLRLYNAQQKPSVKIAGKQRPLASNLTAMVEMNLANPYITDGVLAGLFNPGNRLNDLGIFALDVYDRKKIPVLFIHGINSDPHIWRNAVNAILADPRLSERYQPLLFIYPTGLNVPGAAARLRISLQKYRDFWDPRRQDKNFERMVVVAHSMGGLLTRFLIVDSGEHFWRAFFEAHPSQLSWLDKPQRREVESALIFNRQKFISRAVFICVPHRGSDLADLGIIRLLARLIKLPVTGVSVITKALTAADSGINPALRRYRLMGLRSVDMLSPEHPYFEALEACPIRIPYHSIIGDRGRGDSPDSSDGAVPYWSSHLEGAVSEKIVPYGHSATARTETVHEIMRILRLHLR